MVSPLEANVGRENAMTPREVVEEWVKCFNAGDADALGALIMTTPSTIR